MADYEALSINHPAISLSQAGQTVEEIGEHTAPVTLAADDTIALCKLPAEHIPVDFMLQSADLDTHGTPTITVTVGIMNAAGDDLVASTNFLTASTVCQAGGVARANVVDGLQLASSNTDRVVGLKVITAGATKAAGKVRGVLRYRRA